jgi:hypothetical protein
LIGLDSNSSDNVWSAAGDNGQGVGVYYSTDGAKTATFQQGIGFLNLDLALNEKGNTVMASAGSLLYSVDGKSFEKRAACSSQNVEAFGDSSFVAAGLCTGIYSPNKGTHYNGGALSTDGGNYFYPFDTGMNKTIHPARYGAYPSDSVWYISAGTWPMDDDELAATARGDERVKYLSSKISVDTRGSLPRVNLDGLLGKKKRANVGDGSGFSGAIAKTTDGGKTFLVVHTEDNFYFNAISCANENLCIAAMENEQTGAGVMTTDGGKTWKQVVTDAGMSMMSAKMVSDKEGWLAGGGAAAHGGMEGHFWHSTDGGATWELETLSGNMPIDIAFSPKNNKNAVGYAACISQSTCGVCKYA